MLKRGLVIVIALAAGFLLATVWPRGVDAVRGFLTSQGVSKSDRSAETPSPPAAMTPPAKTAGAADGIRLTDAQVERAAIGTAKVSGGRLTRHLHVPSTIIPGADNTARIAVKTTGTVAELRKGLGDRVVKGEIVALLDSREIADAKGEYLAARVSAALQKTLYERDKELWDKRISSEQQYLRSQASFQDLKVKEDAARRKLTFLGLSAADIQALPNQPEAQFERQEIRSPITGRIVERRVDLGAAVGRDNLETELYSVVDLTKVWIELAVSPGDLPLVHEGQTVAIRTEATGEQAEGRIVFIGPVLDQNTRAARVVAELPNPEERWRPGSFVSAEIRVTDQPVPILIPQTALQTVEGKPTVFVRTAAGFAVRPVTTGRTDDEMTEITSGLELGETIAVANSFTLKAELGKSAAED